MSICHIFESLKEFKISKRVSIERMTRDLIGSTAVVTLCIPIDVKSAADP